jgi:hypothetical protein
MILTAAKIATFFLSFYALAFAVLYATIFGLVASAASMFVGVFLLSLLGQWMFGE